ncbi:hypothetical protein GDO81_027614 [Engystomops pustulosus]|uniref:Uncharacterized protein n=1 Tax=Engystomops pustulosus TaxID=76066 RepID=A0AAV6YJN8_ENGPU|nr:hypothetical protein GDO81_027614 [Engystomops pustulosus]
MERKSLLASSRCKGGREHLPSRGPRPSHAGRVHGRLRPSLVIPVRPDETPLVPLAAAPKGERWRSVRFKYKIPVCRAEVDDDFRRDRK